MKNLPIISRETIDTIYRDINVASTKSYVAELQVDILGLVVKNPHLAALVDRVAISPAEAHRFLMILKVIDYQIEADRMKEAFDE